MEKSLFFDISLYAYLLAFVVYMLWHITQKTQFRYMGLGCLILGAGCNIAFIIRRWLEAGYPPFSNTFETLVFFSCVIALQAIALEAIWRVQFMGSGASLFALGVLACSTMFPTAVRPLMPALRNNFWLTVHVILCFISYASFALSFVAAMAHLIRQKTWHQWLSLLVASLSSVALVGGMTLYYLNKTGKITLVWNLGTGVALAFGSIMLGCLLWFPAFLALRNKIWKIEENILENFIYKAIAFGFPFLTMGILSGSVWANQAWGTYWGWDPKETWSLITWFIYAIYLHARYMVGWKGVRLSWFAVIGFLSVVFTYFGVNYLLSGLHAYAG